VAFVRHGEQHRHVAYSLFCDWILDSHRRLFPQAGADRGKWVRKGSGCLRGDVVARIGIPAPTTSSAFRQARCLVIGARVRPYLSILAEVRNWKGLATDWPVSDTIFRPCQHWASRAHFARWTAYPLSKQRHVSSC
jgi:hypothetical protein